jgi:hypothetical protein
MTLRPWNLAFAALPAALTALAQNAGLPQPDTAANNALWMQYCTTSSGAGANSAVPPQPFYGNPTVLAAAQKFQKVASNSLYPYPVIVSAYGLADQEPPAQWKAKGVTKNAHLFLSYLCGEFRDRASMIRAKVNWINKLNKLPVSGGQQAKLTSAEQDVWMNMVAESYHPFIAFSSALWNARKADPRYSQIVNLGTGKLTGQTYQEPMMVPGLGVCETKYIFNSYLAGGYKPFPGLAAYDVGYQQFAASSGLCKPQDKTDFYDFRGDSNFKPNSPESNGMIWYANSIAAHCQSTTKAKNPTTYGTVTNDKNKVSDETCKDYFTNPFRRRWEAAAAGLSTWLVHDSKDDAQFKNDYGFVGIWVHRLRDGDQDSKSPFGFKFDFNEGSPRRDWMDGYDHKLAWRLTDLGFNRLSGADKGAADTAFVFERLRDAVNRHTNWYQSGWDDGLGTKNSQRTQAYSPFVASSYEPSSSDAFTYCGITVPCPPDGFKHWMFVFRIKGENLVGAQHAANPGLKLDFTRQWLDETSLGTTGLADAEHAWDRLGTAMEEELEGGAILYLHNITSGGQATGDNL